MLPCLLSIAALTSVPAAQLNNSQSQSPAKPNRVPRLHEHTNTTLLRGQVSRSEPAGEPSPRPAATSKAHGTHKVHEHASKDVPPAGAAPPGPSPPRRIDAAGSADGRLEQVPWLPLSILLGATLAPLLLGCVLLGWRSDLGFKVLLVLIFLGLNSGLSLLNRWALGIYGLRFPLVMTAMHMIFGSFALSPMMLLQEKYSTHHEDILSAEWKRIALVGSLNGFQIAMNNASLTMIELSLNQVIRAFGPVFVALLAVCIEGKIPSQNEALTLLCISVGVAMTAGKNLTPSAGGSFLGICLTVASIVMQSSIISLSSRMMGGRHKLVGLQMAFYSGPFAFLALLPFALMKEYDVFLVSLDRQGAASVAFLLGSCVMAVLYNVTVFQSSHTLSSVGTAVLANAKIILLIFLSAVILGELASWSLQEFCGCTLALGGTAYFSYLKLKTK